MLRTRPLAVSIALLLATPAFAQESNTTAADADAPKQLDKVVITGSNLRGVDLAEAQPVVVVDRAAIEQTGATNLTDLVRQIAETGGGTGNFSTANSGALQADSPAGQAGISLRGLGTSSTLTLVNGRRVAVSSFANGSENFVDINAIPLAAVDRIEVLTTGASAVYGADAVAGVVNVILRKDFDGVRLEASYGDSTRGTDEGRYDANLVWGWRGAVNGLVVVDAFQRNALYDRDRAISAVEPRPSQQGIYPSINDADYARDDLVEAACPRSQFKVGSLGEYCEVNRNAYTATDPWSRQIGAYGQFDAKLGDAVEWFSEVQLQHNKAKADAAPAPWDDVPIGLNNPGLPAELRQRLVAGGYDLANLTGYGRFPDARTIEVTTDNWRVLNGLRGSLGNWDWETALSFARSHSKQDAIAGIYNVARFRAATQGQLCADGRITCTPGVDGLWYDPFGGQTRNSAQVLNLLREKVPREGVSTLQALDAKLNGNAGRIGDRDIAWAFGVEARHEKITDEPSPLATADDNGNVPVYGFGSTAVTASRSQWAAYVETNLPLLATLDLRAAGRYDHYSDFGGDFNPAVSLRWRPTDRIVLRGGWNTSFRAPSLAQVGAGETLSSGALPCAAGSEFSGTTNFCGGRTRDDSYLSEIYGNPDLKPETATAYYLGTVLDLGARTSLSLDYFNFDQKDVVGINDLELFRLALANPTAYVYRTSNGIPRGVVGIATRNGAVGGNIDDVHLQLTNVGRQKTDGVDIKLDHRFGETSIGRLSTWVDGTYTRSFERSESCSAGVPTTRRGAGPCENGQRLVELAGQFRYPKWLVNTGVKWSRDAWHARLWANYTSSYFDDDQRQGVPAGRRVASWTTLNLNVGWDFTERQSIDVNIRNLADRDPPLSLGSTSNVDLYNHDTLGRFVTVRYVFNF